MLNAMTIDVEDYFHVSAFSDIVARSEWDTMESRVCASTERLLRLLDRANVRATCFVLGWVAERFPDLVARLHAAGHELASHSYDHGLVYARDPDDFRRDLRQAREAIEAASGVRVTGFRAPSYSVTQGSLWALDVLIEEGYRFDSSIYPIRHDRYGIASWPRHVHTVRRAGGTLVELPGSTVRRMGVNLPMGGGGYFRQLPYGWTRAGIRRLNEVERQPAIFYIHPWEVDPDQPRLAAPLATRVRHYRGLGDVERRFGRLLQEFRFGTIAEVLAENAPIG